MKQRDQVNNTDSAYMYSIFLTHILISQFCQNKSCGQGNQADLSGQVRVVTVVG